MTRAFLLVMDSVGIGGAPDAAEYGDAGANTIGHIAAACAQGKADSGGRSGPLRLPNLAALGLGEACRKASGGIPAGLGASEPRGLFGAARERSKGKDTPSGHWEIAGVPVPFDWGYFPKTDPAFPAELTEALIAEAGLPGVLGLTHASGTDIIARLGVEHMGTGRPIVYTSADSVYQIAAHERTFGLERLYTVCEVAFRLVAPWRIGRVIARPFVGTGPHDFKRTSNRRDFAVPPPSPTLLDVATSASRQVVTIGKIADIFAHSGTGEVKKADGNMALFDRTIEACADLRDGGFAFANFIDFDSEYGHRRDVAGYAAALEAFDARLPELFERLRPGDLVAITADHGCDPTWPGTDHTREQVPVLACGPGIAPRDIGSRDSYADIAATIAEHLELPAVGPGTSFLRN